MLGLPDMHIKLLNQLHLDIEDRPADIHRLIDEFAIEGHRLSMWLAPNRIMTITQILELFGWGSPEPFQARARQVGMEPVFEGGGTCFYMAEDIPRLYAYRVREARASEYVPARIRKAVARVMNPEHRATLRRRFPAIRWDDWKGKPHTVAVTLDKSVWDALEEERKADGWHDSAQLVRALLISYYETHKIIKDS